MLILEGICFIACYLSSFLFCEIYTNLLKIILGTIFDASAVNFIVTPGIIINLFFSIFLIVNFATYSLENEGNPNLTPATLLKLVFTGPGHNTLILTLEFCYFNSSLKDWLKRNT